MQFSGSEAFVLALLMVNGALAAKKGGVKPETGGKSSSGRIAGGTERYVNPQMVSIQYIKDGERFHHCAGTIVRVDWILTAAHCLFEQFLYLVVGGTMDAYEEENGQDTTVQIRYVRWTTVHEEYNRETLENDIGLILLQAPFDITLSVEIAKLANLKSVIPQQCHIYGWGKTSLQRRATKQARRFPHQGASRSKNKASRRKDAPLFYTYVYLPVLDIGQCEGQMHFDNPKPFKRDSIFCAGGEAGKGTCDGDDGGPMMCESNEWVVAGIVSRGFGCGRQGYPTVFTRVAYYREWMNATIDENQDLADRS